MPPNTATNGSSNATHGRKRSVPGRVQPAIPLALSKPRPSRLRQTTGVSTRAGAEATPKDVTPVGSAQDETSFGQNKQRSEAGPQHEDVVSAAPAASPISRGSAPMSMSNGATPEPAVTAGSPSTTSPDTTTSPTVTMSPSFSRKPTDRFDLRQIRTELPPPFVPLAEQQTPQSAMSPSRPTSQSFSHGHSHNPSTASIVFGGHDSTTSSPAPPQSASSGFQVPSYPPSSDAQPPTFAPNGHTYHVSEPQAHRQFYPGYGSPASPWSTRNGNHMPQPPQFQPQTSFRYPPREVFTPADTQQANGYPPRSRSVSHSSSAAPKTGDDLQSPYPAENGRSSAKMMFHEPKVAFPGPLNARHHHTQSHMPAPTMPPPDLASGPDNAEILRSHVLSQFSDPSLADCHLQILEENGGGRSYIDGHKIILSRSPKLLALIESSDPPASATLKTQVHVQLTGDYVRLFPFMQSLKYLYGGPLLSFELFRHQITGGESLPTQEERIENALQHCATGAWLQSHAIAARGLDVASSLLHWDTLSTALAFALDGGLSHVWTIDDGSEDRISCSSSDDSLGRSETISTPTHDPYATQLLHRIIHFTVHMLPPNFYLDASAPQLATCPRLPSLPLGHESRPSLSDPRLSGIRFGEMSVEDHQRPSFVTTTISSMMLSVPFMLLKCMLEHFDLAGRLGPDTVGSIMRQVVAEREARRTKALKARSAVEREDDADPHLLQNLYWEELVEPSNQHRAGFRLARRRCGIDTPPSSGGGSERSK